MYIAMTSLLLYVGVCFVYYSKVELSPEHVLTIVKALVYDGILAEVCYTPVQISCAKLLFKSMLRILAAAVNACLVKQQAINTNDSVTRTCTAVTARSNVCSVCSFDQILQCCTKVYLI
jgi:hypothetical protein